jgi:hypothetical protein
MRIGRPAERLNYTLKAIILLTKLYRHKVRITKKQREPMSKIPILTKLKHKLIKYIIKITWLITNIRSLLVVRLIRWASSLRLLKSIKLSAFNS